MRRGQAEAGILDEGTGRGMKEGGGASMALANTATFVFLSNKQMQMQTIAFRDLFMSGGTSVVQKAAVITATAVMSWMQFLSGEHLLRPFPCSGRPAARWCGG